MNTCLSDAAAALGHLVVPELAEQLAAALGHDPLQDEVVARDERDHVHVVLRLGAVDARVVHIVPEEVRYVNAVEREAGLVAF